MDLSIHHLCSYGASEHSRAVDSTTKLYPTFTAPTPLNKAHIGNTLTQGMIPSPLNLPAITPPASPYSIFGLYSPGSGPNGSPLCDPGYLRRLKNNPMFRDLQSLLLQECLQMQVPSNLITTSWNLMQLHKTTPTDQSTNHKAASSLQPPVSANQNSATSLQPSASGSGQQVYMQHMKFQDKLLKVRIDPAISADGLSVENEYSTEVGNIEMERYRALNSCPDEKVKDTINGYYDKQRLKLIQNTEEKLDQLINKAERMRREVLKSNNSAAVNITKTIQGEQPTLPLSGTAQGASLLLQPVDEKDKIYAVRKLKFNDEAEDNDDENDYLNGSVNSEDFEIDEIDVETVDKIESTAYGSVLVSSYNDILKKCIEESGLNAFANDISPVDLSTAASINSNESMIPDSTSSASDSPISMSSAEDLTNQNLSTDGSDNSTFSKEEHSVSPFHFEEQLKKPVTRNLNFDNHMFSTPTSNSGMKFTNPDNIQAALSEIQKLCGASTMTITPEYKKDMGEFYPTPVDVKPMPLNEISSAFNMPSANMSYQPVSNHMYQYGGKQDFQKRHLHHHQHEQQQQLKLQQHMARPTFPRSSSPNDNFKQQHYSYHQQQQFHHQDQGHQHKTHQYQPQRSKSIDSTNNNFQLNNDNITTTSNGNNTNNNQDSMNISNSGKSIKTEDFQFENTPVFRTHRMLTPESTEVLLTWYNAHVNYPYPNDEEVEHLTKLTGITARQVKKWMANRRVRCFNTLSITGNQHPIKHKYKGQGRKRKAPMPEKSEKENCDSTTADNADKRPNYSMLGEEAKSILSEWYEQHIDNPYPTEEEKIQLAEHCRITVNQVKSWFANKRNRTNNTKRQVPNYFIERFPEYSGLVHLVGQKREEERMLKRRKVNEVMYIQPPFYF